MYVEGELFPRSMLSPTPCLDVPLRTLAGHASFWTYLTDERTSDSMYCHVYSLVLYLIQRNGMDCFLQAFRDAAGGTNAEWEVRFTTAIRSNYGLELEDIERQWRQDSAVTLEGALPCWEWLSPTAQSVIRKAQDRARQREAEVEMEHLLWAILQYRRSIAFR